MTTPSFQGGALPPLQPTHPMRSKPAILGMVLIAVCVLAYFINDAVRGDSASLKAGDCFQNSGSEKEPDIEKRDCGDPRPSTRH
ncbi:hypothetical protein [Streptomyces sp. H27-D2]|uniref:hypothetical protein n=1 Tax=Streptomyces sp. H27-D2 TaxID=3046304 RepID=UPI002DBBBEDA|nr:hypothetical protein [Streptomyces sp. H27-D2]MEC4016535.1 hypothetical protein [Streptomyces sp. H27-D2]